MKRERADKLLVEKGHFPSRQQAQSAILARQVRVGEMIVEKPGQLCANDSKFVIQQKETNYVSRGGSKLEKALHFFHIDPTGWIVLDIGASTGGFTDCLLQHGAKQVYAVDVGYGQLDYRLRKDPRVMVSEKTNARYLKPSDFTVLFDLATIDVSFISLTKIFPAVFPLLRPDGQVVALIKPQFEAGKGEVGKKGVVRDPEKHQQIIKKIRQAGKENGFVVLGDTESPILGPEGNREFLLHMEKPRGKGLSQ